MSFFYVYFLYFFVPHLLPWTTPRRGCLYLLSPLSEQTCLRDLGKQPSSEVCKILNKNA